MNVEGEFPFLGFLEVGKVEGECGWERGKWGGWGGWVEGLVGFGVGCGESGGLWGGEW